MKTYVKTLTAFIKADKELRIEYRRVNLELVSFLVNSYAQIVNLSGINDNYLRIQCLYTSDGNMDALEKDLRERFEGVNMTVLHSDFSQQVTVDSEIVTGKIDTIQIIFRHYEW